MIKRRTFIAGLGSAAAWPAVTRGQQVGVPVVGVVWLTPRDASATMLAAFRKGLGETGYVDGRNVTVVYHFLEGQYDLVPMLMADLVHRQVAVIVALGPNAVALAAKAATATIPTLFMVSHDPVLDGLVASVGRPGGNATGVNILVQEVAAKRLAMLHKLVPNAVRIAVLLNPNNGQSEALLQEVQEVARTIGLQIQAINAGTSNEIDAAFDTFARDRPDALFVANDPFFHGRGVQFATLTARDRIPAAYQSRDLVAAGGLMSYGTDLTESFRQIGVYTGDILKGAKPGDLPVVQSTKFEFVINLRTARSLGIEVPPTLLALADEVIE